MYILMMTTMVSAITATAMLAVTITITITLPITPPITIPLNSKNITANNNNDSPLHPRIRGGQGGQQRRQADMQ